MKNHEFFFFFPSLQNLHPGVFWGADTDFDGPGAPGGPGGAQWGGGQGGPSSPLRGVCVPFCNTVAKSGGPGHSTNEKSPHYTNRVNTSNFHMFPPEFGNPLMDGSAST